MNGEQLRTFRSNLGVSRAALVRLLGVSEQTLIRWENGLGAPGGVELVVLEVLVDLHRIDPQGARGVIKTAETDLRGALTRLFAIAGAL